MRSPVLAAGHSIGGYRVVRLLGRGGMATVYEAVNEQIRRRVAIKVLSPELAARPDIASRFLNEARAANVIEHPGVVEVSDFGRLPGGAPYIVMELLRGESLGERMRRVGPAIATEALRLVRQIAGVLAAAHAQQIVHRDLKPDNVMIVPDPESPGGERVKVLDFGIAKVTDALRGPDDGGVRTHSDVVMGTPLYMSPEQCRGPGRVDDRADVYSLGIMLYRMLAGRLPFAAESSGEIIAMHLLVAPTQLLEVAPAVGPDLAALVHRMLEKDPAARPAMREVGAELERLGAPPASEPPPAPWRAPEPEAPEASPSTLGQATGDARSRSRRRPAALLWVVPPLVLLLSGITTYRWLERGGTAPPAQRVRWTVRSEPPGAAVVAEDGRVLGATPWQEEGAAAPGKRTLLLRRAGYADRRIELSTTTDAARTERLDLAPRPGVPPLRGPQEMAPLRRARKGAREYFQPVPLD